MTHSHFTQDMAPTQYVEGGGIRFAYRRFGIPNVFRWCSSSTSWAPWMTTTRL